MLKQMGGGKGFLNNVQKTALFSRDGFPNSLRGMIHPIRPIPPWVTTKLPQLIMYSIFDFWWLKQSK